MAVPKKRSRKRSATRSGPPDVTFFIDRCLGKHVVADALREAGAEVRVHDDFFPQDAPDEEWLRQAGKQRWVVLTKDSRIRYRKGELSSIMRFGVRVFVLTAKHVSGQAMAEIWVGSLPAIRNLLARHPGPFIAQVTRARGVRILVA
jgi:predicted nuclease of predicted toxin-antitoxin system